MRYILKIRSFLFENTTLRQTIVKNTFWQGASISVSRVIKALLIMYAARVLGAEGYGVFSYALGLAGFFTLFSDIGVGGIFTREAVQNPNKLPRYFSTAFCIKFILILLSSLLILGVAPFITKIPEAIPLLPLAALLIAFDGLRDFTLSLARVKEKMQIEAGFQTLTNVSITIFGIVALFLQASPLFLLSGYTIGSGIGAFFSFRHFRANFQNLLKSFDGTLVLHILKEAWPFALVGALGSIMANTDTIMLGWFLDAKAVGLYSAALRPVQLFYFLPVILSVSVFPTFARFAGKEPEQFRKVFEAALLATFLVAFPLLAGGLVLSSEVITFIFGASYLAATPAFVVLLFTILTNFPSSFFITGIFAHGKQTYYALSLVLGALGNVLLNFVLIPRYGILGAAIATFSAQLVSYSVMWIIFSRIAPFTLFRRLPRILLATLCMAGVVEVLKILGVSFLFLVASGVILYFTILLLLRERVLFHLQPKRLFSRE